jgi:hypothetical protein
MTRHALSIVLLAALAAVAPAADGHGHDHGHDHDHGSAVAAGSMSLAGATVAVGVAGAVKPGAEVHVELAFTPAQPAPKAVRIWIGSESGRGSARARAGALKRTPGAYAAHVEVPSPLPADSRIWINVEPASGEAVKGSVALP